MNAITISAVYLFVGLIQSQSPSWLSQPAQCFFHPWAA